MGNSLAIVVGINEYERLTKLKYAKQDALKIKGFLEEAGEAQSILLCTDDSEPIDGKPTRATHTNLSDLLLTGFEEPFLSPEENLWFFFSGHGLRYKQKDYLVPIDGNPRDIDRTCITVDYVTERLSNSGAGNIVLILDACRNASEGGKGGAEALGEEARECIRERGLISIFACRPQEQSWEEDTLGHGIFTFALLKALEEATCATVRQISAFLRREVPALAERYGKPSQTPWMVAAPIEKADLILSLKNVKEADLDGLKKTALEAEVEGNYDSALELWNRVNIASRGRDRQCLAAVSRIELKRHLDSERQREEQERLLAAQRKHDELVAEQRQREEAEIRERDEREQLEKKRLQAEQKEKEQLEAEKRQREERERLEIEKRQAEKDRLAAEQVDKERLTAEQRQREAKARLTPQQSKRETQGYILGLGKSEDQDRPTVEQREQERLATERREKKGTEAEQRQLAEPKRLEAEQLEIERQRMFERLVKSMPKSPGRVTLFVVPAFVLIVGSILLAVLMHYKSSVDEPPLAPAASDMAKQVEVYAQYSQRDASNGGYASFYNAGLAAYEKGDYSGAIREFDEAIPLDPRNGSAYFMRGLAYYAQSSYQKAISDFTKVITLDPANAKAHFNRGLAYFSEKNYQAAIDSFNEALIWDSSDGKAYYRRGLAFRQLGDQTQAQTDFDKAKSLGYVGS
jgi:uncharacterized caspase-like protein/cytochrome c-type biogenesis protein CcmH/NrfG